MTNMWPSEWLYDFLRGYEKFRPTAYKPTRDDVWTCGYGHTHGVTAETICTMELANAWLAQDVGWAVEAVNRDVQVTLTQAQFDALVSLCFNIGATLFGKSTLVLLLNSGVSKALVAGQFLRFDKQKGVELAGLKKRREAERARFLSTPVAASQPAGVAT